MPEFLELLPPGEALAILLRHLPETSPRVELTPTPSALGRVTARPVISPEALPAFPRSTVDGYAVRAEDTHGASDSLPAYLALTGEVPMGKPADMSVSRGQAVLIHTGGMLPAGADAVVMLEHTQAARPGELEVLRAVGAGENILDAGEDVAQGQEVLPAGVRLRPAEIGGLLALGLLEVPVARPPRIAILSSGDEVVAPEATPAPGQVRDVNSYTLSALVQSQGGQPLRYGIVPDDAATLRARLARALTDCEAVVVTAGSSASARDLTADAIDSLGEPGVLVHGVNVRPGKPTILAVCNGKPVIGLPGNPVSSLVIAGLFVAPVVRRLLGIPADRPQPVVSARLAVNLASLAGREDWIPVRLIPSSGGYTADPIFFKSNLIFSLARADGLLHIPPDSTGLSTGETVNVYLL